MVLTELCHVLVTFGFQCTWLNRWTDSGKNGLQYKYIRIGTTYSFCNLLNGTKLTLMHQ